MHDAALLVTRWGSELPTDVHKHCRCINAEIVRQAGSVQPSDELDFVCECADPACFGVLTMPLADYLGHTSAPDSYAVHPGHEVLVLRAA